MSRRVTVVVAALLALLGADVAGTPAASAAQVHITQIGTVTNPADGAFIDRTAVTIRGVKDAGSTVTVRVGGGSGCTAPAADLPLETWSCQLTLPNGPAVTVTAQETLEDDDERSASVTVAVLGAPTVFAPEGPTTGIIDGVGYPGARITLAVSGGAPDGTVPSCPVPVAASGYWSCAGLPGGTYSVTATQSAASIRPGASSQSSAPAQVTVDVTPPPPPVITSPAAGTRVLTQPFTIAGTGENGGRVLAQVNSVPVCSAIVSGGVWLCRAGSVPHGAGVISAVLSDAAGWQSVASPIAVEFGPPPAVAPPVAPAPSTPSAPPSPEPTPEPAEPPAPEPEPEPEALPWTEIPIFPGPDGYAPTLGEALTNWGTPTAFGWHILSPAQSVEQGNWPLAPVFAVLGILLLALPLRLLATSVRTRRRWPWVTLTGRNTAAARPAPDAVVKRRNPWLMGAIPLAITALLVVLAQGMNGEVRYLRLLAAVGMGLALLNVVGVAVAIRFVSARQRLGSWLRFLPLLLFAAVVAAALSRFTGISPPVVSGVLIGAGFAMAVPARPRAIVNAAILSTVLLLGVGGWFAHSAFQSVSPDTGFWPMLATELLATLCLAGIGSATVLVLPIGALPGRALLEWSPMVWVVAAFAVFTVAAGILGGGTEASHFPGVGAILAGAAFAAMCTAVWAWDRFVQPPNRNLAS